MNNVIKIAAPPNRPLRLFRQIASGVLLASAGLYFVLTWQWPLVGDASLIHYICFLMDHGMAPYRDLGDMNMPGSYLVEWVVMHTLGGGAIAWRIYDFGLMIAAAAAIVSITRPFGWFAGIFGSSIFVLVHGRDGMAQGGQRDLTMAVALIVATAFLFKALRQNEIWASALFGLFAGIAITIKPTALLFAAGLLAMAVYTLRRRAQPAMGIALASSCALSFGPLIAAIFLWKQHALGAFIDGLRSIVPYYASLGHRPLGFLLIHSVSPLLPLIILWLAVLVTVRPPIQWERAALMAGVAFGLISYVVQARGYPYYRYPLMAFLLPLMAIDMTAALRTSSSKLERAIAVTGIAVGAFVIAPMSARLIQQYDWHNIDFITSLETNLNRLGGGAVIRTHSVHRLDFGLWNDAVSDEAGTADRCTLGFFIIWVGR